MHLSCTLLLLTTLIPQEADPALFAAAKNGDAAQIRKLVQKGAKLNEANNFGMTPLHAAVYWDRQALVPVLVSLGADLTARTARAWGDGKVNYEPGLTPLDLAKLRKLKGMVDTLQKALNRGMCDAVAKINAAAVKKLLEGGAQAGSDSCYGDAPSALAQAALKGNTEIATLLLEHGADPTGNGAPLRLACEARALPMVKLLLDHHVDINAAWKKQEVLPTPITDADLPMVQMLLDAGLSPDTAGPTQTPLMVAARTSLTMTQAMLAHGGHASAPGTDGRTALHEAASAANVDTCKALLDAGADVNAKDREGVTPLMLAARGNNAAAAKLLLERGANAKAADNRGASLLHAAANNPELIALLIGRGAVYEADHDGNTPLHLCREPAAMNAFVTLKGDVMARNKDGDTPLHLRVQDTSSKAPAAVKLLLQKGADVNATNKALETPLHLATNETLPILLEAHANINGHDNEGMTPLMAQASRNNIANCLKLIQATADVQVHDMHGFTALHWAGIGGAGACMEALVAKGVSATAASTQAYTSDDGKKTFPAGTTALQLCDYFNNNGGVFSGDEDACKAVRVRK